MRKFNTEAEYNAAETLPTKNYVSLIGSGIVYDKGVTEGVYIQHIDGKLYDEAGWTNGGFSNDEANGVAVITAKASFVIAKNNLGKIMWSSNTSARVNGILTSSDSTIALTDLAGYDNTQLMLATDTSGAGYSCANYTFPNGNKGYLPALGEWQEAYANKSKIDSLMTKIGGDAFSSYSSYWSSTQSSYDRSWRLGWSNGELTYNLKVSTGNYARAFSAL